jgi:hypothetical protein
MQCVTHSKTGECFSRGVRYMTRGDMQKSGLSGTVGNPP